MIKIKTRAFLKLPILVLKFVHNAYFPFITVTIHAASIHAMKYTVHPFYEWQL